MTALEIAFWACAGLLVYAQVGYALLLAGIARLRRGWSAAGRAAASRPTCPLIVAAYDEEAVIARQGRQRCARSTTRATASR